MLFFQSFLVNIFVLQDKENSTGAQHRVHVQYAHLISMGLRQSSGLHSALRIFSWTVVKVDVSAISYGTYTSVLPRPPVGGGLGGAAPCGARTGTIGYILR